MLKPYVEEIITDKTPYELFLNFSKEKEIMFLDSSLYHKKLGQYSFIAFEPFIKFRYKNKTAYINEEKKSGDCFELLEEIFIKYKSQQDEKLPFTGGGMGYFSYDLAREYFEIEDKTKELCEVFDCYYNFYDVIIAFDHEQSKTYLSYIPVKSNSIEKFNAIKNKIAEMKKVDFDKGYSVNIVEKDKTDFKSMFSPEQYMDMVEKMKEYIREGDIYIGNLTHTFSGYTKRTPLQIYNNLRRINPAPFSAFLGLAEYQILSSSPERFLQINNRRVTTRPIKGTVPRGKNQEEDKKYIEKLMNSEKDKSELLMVVDLERNDLSKVCKPKSVKVESLFEIESYATVHHLVAEISAELEGKNTTLDCIKACFPGGSITGTPKYRTMQVIEELEKTKRNIYTGAIGYLGFDGNADLNITIRTILYKNGKLWMGVGGGITWESDREEEYKETLDKAKALFNSINN